MDKFLKLSFSICACLSLIFSLNIIAQEVEEVIPEVVTEKVPCLGEFCENTEKYKTVDYAKLVPVLIEAIKDLSEEVEELKKKLS